jgi:transcriptional regulator with XRE-family HTH domain
MDARKLGKKIKVARVELDLNQSELAEKIGAKQKSISRYENGLSMPSIKTLLKLAQILKKPTAYFLEFDKTSHST